VVKSARNHSWTNRRGTAPADVLVVLVIVVVGTLLLCLAVVRWRSDARDATCRQHLSRIGEALRLHDQTTGHLPPLDPPPSQSAMSGPLARLLAGLGQYDLDGMTPGAKSSPARREGAPGPARTIPGLLCPEDPESRRTSALAPTSYRACAGAGTDATDGAFRAGTPRSLAQIEAADGALYTSLFSERLLGTGQTSGSDDRRDYEVGPLTETARGPWPRHIDAGFRWDRGTWQDALYNHAERPGQGPSRIEPDGHRARLSAGSGHRAGVHVLRADGSVGVVTPRVDLEVWRRLGNVGTGRSDHTDASEKVPAAGSGNVGEQP
jgi:hypothetical protein